jgi:glycosyltransferase involved in cell wall biosynthesis
MNKALLISYRFPPQGGGGVQRTLKFAKYLREFGWEPVVQTARNPYWPVWDETLLRDVPPGVRVYRTPAFEFERLESRLGGLVGERERPSVARRNGDGEAAAPRKPRRTGMIGALRAGIHRRLLVPDPQIAWVPGALLHGLLIARREGVRLVYTSSPPNSVQLLGGLVARALGKPWVADFRDPWTDGPRRQLAYVGNPMRARFERAAERAVLRRADRIVVSAEPLRARFLEHYPFLAPDKVVVLTNGYDPDDFAAAADEGFQLENGRFHVTGTGNIEAMFDARPLLRALAELSAENSRFGDELLVNLVGAKKGKYDADLRALGLADRVRYPGWLPHAQSLSYLEQSDVLLMCQMPDPRSGGEKLSGKCFEYLFARKPILCLSVPGVSADLMQESGVATVVHPEDVAGIKTALRAFYARRGQPVRADSAVIARFDRRRLTERLAAMFDALAGSPERPPIGAALTTSIS